MQRVLFERESKGFRFELEFTDGCMDLGDRRLIHVPTGAFHPFVVPSSLGRLMFEAGAAFAFILEFCEDADDPSEILADLIPDLAWWMSRMANFQQEGGNVPVCRTAAA